MMPFKRRADFVARHGEETRLGAVGGIRLVAGLGKRALGFGAVGDVAADTLHFGGCAGIEANQRLAPGDPARAERGFDSLVVNPRAVGFDRAFALFEHSELKAAADQLGPLLAGQFAIGVVDEGDPAVGVAQHDQVALRFEQAARALFGFLQFPIAVGHRLVMQRDLAHLLAQETQPHADGRERQAGDRKQEARADRKIVGIVARMLRTAAGDEAIGAAEGRGEDHKRANGDGYPGMTPREAAQMQFDPDHPPHHRSPNGFCAFAYLAMKMPRTTLRSA